MSRDGRDDKVRFQLPRCDHDFVVRNAVAEMHRNQGRFGELLMHDFFEFGTDRLVGVHGGKSEQGEKSNGTRMRLSCTWTIGSSSSWSRFFGARLVSTGFEVCAEAWLPTSPPATVPAGPATAAATVAPTMVSAILRLVLLVPLSCCLWLQRAAWSPFLALIHDDEPATAAAPDAEHQALAGEVLRRAVGVLCVGDGFAIDLLDHITLPQARVVGG